ncbi:MAG: hypothetical protein QNJ49_22580 [Mastigocoleus sp. MO_167.B18]|nr:hypothetical protein [Mastigocoleus sp. MO_167.B18]
MDTASCSYGTYTTGGLLRTDVVRCKPIQTPLVHFTHTEAAD